MAGLTKKCCVLISGEVLGLLGPNGAGKSTVIKMIAGETTLTAGQVGGCWSLEGRDRSVLKMQSLWPAKQCFFFKAILGIRVLTRYIVLLNYTLIKTMVSCC